MSFETWIAFQKSEASETFETTVRMYLSSVFLN